MSVLHSSDFGSLLSHCLFIKNLYKAVNFHSDVISLHQDKVFNVYHSFRRSNQKELKKRSLDEADCSYEVLLVKNAFLKLQANLIKEYISEPLKREDLMNSEARSEANKYFSSISSDFVNISGGCDSSKAVIARICNDHFVLPPHSTFHVCDICHLKEKVKNNKYDLVLMDPPWSNRFIKRRKKNNREHGYSIICDEELLNIGLDKVLKDSAILAVWLTNSPSHIDFVKSKLFPSCGMEYAATWFWIKVTKLGELVCNFNENLSQKQPFERVVFGVRGSIKKPPDGKIFLSVPSSIHSHKPPLCELLAEYLPEGSKCLELFARYLLPGWTSIGNQVLSMQLLSLFERIPP